MLVEVWTLRIPAEDWPHFGGKLAPWRRQCAGRRLGRRSLGGGGSVLAGVVSHEAWSCSASESDGLLSGGKGGSASSRARRVSASNDAGFFGSRATFSIWCHAFAYGCEYGLVTDRIRVAAARMSFGLARLSASARSA